MNIDDNDKNKTSQDVKYASRLNCMEYMVPIGKASRKMDGVTAEIEERGGGEQFSSVQYRECGARNAERVEPSSALNAICTLSAWVEIQCYQ